MSTNASAVVTDASQQFPPPPQVDTASNATSTVSTPSTSQASAALQAASDQPYTPSFITKLFSKLCKDLSLVNIITTILATIALLYGAKSYNEAARANDLATRESCRQHPNNSALQATSVCQSMRKAHDFDGIPKRELGLIHLDSWGWLPQEYQWSMILEPFCLCIILLCIWRAAALIVDDESRPTTMLGFSFYRLLIFLLLLATAWSS